MYAEIYLMLKRADAKSTVVHEIGNLFEGATKVGDKFVTKAGDAFGDATHVEHFFHPGAEERAMQHASQGGKFTYHSDNTIRLGDTGEVVGHYKTQKLNLPQSLWRYHPTATKMGMGALGAGVLGTGAAMLATPVIGMGGYIAGRATS